MIDFVGPATRRTAAGLAHAATLIGCNVDALQADIQVEAASSGYDSARRPKALFEPHVFYRHLSGAGRQAAELRGLAYPRWGTYPYPRDSYDRIAQAMRIDPEAALMATSWGLPQILGENHAAAGYSSATAMVEAFVAGGEDEHLAAMARFIVSNSSMRRALCERQWSTFARLYNGPASKGYDVRLAAAYQRAAAIDPAEINVHVAATAAQSAAHAKSGGIAVAGAILIGVAPAAHLASHGLGSPVVALVALSVAVSLGLALRTIAFGHKAKAFAAASLLAAQTMRSEVASPPLNIVATQTIDAAVAAEFNI